MPRRKLTIAQKWQVIGLQEHTFASKSKTISCDVNKTISIVDFNVEPFTTSIAKYKQCNLTEEQTNAIKRGCNRKKSCTISTIIQNSCLLNDYGHVSVSYSCTGVVNRSCTFENDYGCGWLVSGYERYQWKLRRGTTPETYTGPQKDHTTASAYGYYAYTESRSGSKLNDESDLLSGLIVPSPKQCLTFWYHMYGRHINTLKIFQSNSDHNIELWSKSKSKGNKWHFQSLALKNIGSYQIIFKGIRGNGSKSEIAVDDISISNTVCNKVSRFDCNFEAGICEWNAELTPKYTWKIFSGKTPSPETGPGVDHTSGSSHGHYIYLEATAVQKGATSKLTSNTINTVDGVCLTFWYHMYGKSMGTLNVYTESGNITTRYWSQSGNQGNSWNFVSFDISSSEPYTITFEGVCGDFCTSDIALDDIVILQRSCSGLIKYTQSCHKTDESISLSGCSQYYLQPNSTRFVFDREFENCSAIYQDVQTSASTLCNNENRSDVCTFNLSDVIRKDPKCFLSNRLMIQYNCEDERSMNIPGSSQESVGMPMYTIIGISALLVVLIAALVFTIVICNRRKKAKHSQPPEVRTNPTATERNSSSDYTTVNYNEMRDVSLPEIHQIRHENRTTHRERQATTAVIEQVGNNYNRYESLSTNRTSIEHIYEQESIHTNQYELLTNQRESVEHTYEYTEHQSPPSTEPNLSQYQSLTNPSESDTHASTASLQ
ncbi:unnamed protein product [Mytilus coruscus]|uniref:MAM domain-containing protein n=1 Tax=Mytilus coruscus TaxID=42192 RepID=A0A6J8F307_MYTCO|nr:unnamed protein product [Mytilus coruscus]